MTLPPKHPGVIGTGDETPEQQAAIKQHDMQEGGEAERLAACYAAVLSTVEGRAVVWDIVAQHLRAFDTVRVGDTNLTIADLARHNMGLHLWSELRKDYPAETRLMQQENDE